MADVTDDTSKITFFYCSLSNFLEKSVPPILKSAGTPISVSERKDSNGNMIKKGTKGYKISFNPQLENVHHPLIPGDRSRKLESL